MPEYAQSVNAAIAGAADGLKKLLQKDSAGGLAAAIPGELGAVSLAGGMALSSSFKAVDAMLGDLKMVYAFRGDYLITAFSQKALDAALDGGAAPLAQDAAFIAAGINPRFSVGWTYVPNPGDLSGEEIARAILSNLGMDDGAGTDMKDTDTAGVDVSTTAVPATPGKSGKGRATTPRMPSQVDSRDDIDMMFGDGEMMSGMVDTVSDLMADLINRYDGQTVQSAVQGNVITSKSKVLYRW
ncbi:hypothetical protein [Deinococcus frigens]|uniref:hypothetical protein n=1 Tax=Deinococcus frigens TaxID=249403 RepID=UPI000A0582D7|nr:hypothetical protein [Deinococcus frigens]